MKLKAAVSRSAALALLIFVSWMSSAAQSDSIYHLPAGTRISLKLDAEINSRVSSVNDTFLASVAEPVRVRNAVVLPAGTVIEGRVAGVTAAGNGGQPGKLDLVFETLHFGNGSTGKMVGVPFGRLDRPADRTFNYLSVIGGTLAGALLGAVTGSAKGALIGAGIGASVGTGAAIARKGKETRIRKGEKFEIELKELLVLPVQDY